MKRCLVVLSIVLFAQVLSVPTSTYSKGVDYGKGVGIKKISTGYGSYGRGYGKTIYTKGYSSSYGKTLYGKGYGPNYGRKWYGIEDIMVKDIQAGTEKDMVIDIHQKGDIKIFN